MAIVEGADASAGGSRPAGPAGRLRAWRARVRTDHALRAEAAVARPGAVARAGLLVWAPVLVSLGIGGWFALPVEPGRAAYASVLVLALLALAVAVAAPRWAARGRLGWDMADRLRLGGRALALIAAGTMLAGARAHMVAAPVLDFRYYGPIEGRVVATDRSARDRMRLTLDRVVLRDTDPARTPERVRISLTEVQDLPAPGRRVMLTGHLGPPPGPAEPGGFDFRRAAFFDSLGAVGYTRNPFVTVGPEPAGLMASETLRLRLSAGMRQAIGGQAGAVAAALMTGDRSGIAEATNQVMRDSNLYHIVSISGLHMSMLAGFIYAALRLGLAAAQAVGPLAAALAGRPVHKLAAAVALMAASVYLWLSGGGVPTERSFIMVAVMLLAILVDRRALSLRTVAVAALVVLVMAPEALVSAGFQMSFAATVALIALFPAWAQRAAVLPWVVRGAAMLILSSLIAGLATSPIAAAHFNRSAQYGLIANLLAVPVMGALVMPAGVVAAVLAPLGLAGPALWVMGLGTRWMLWVAETVAGWGGAVTAVSAPHWAALPLMGVGATAALLFPWGAARGALRAAGLMLIGVGALVWFGTTRPDILIADEGAAVGILTDGGRALAKPGGAFAAESWLRADGDVALAVDAAARPGWTGSRGERVADLRGTRIVYLSGKGGVKRAAEACAAGGVVVLAGKAASKATQRGRETPACALFDANRLRRTGAMAGWITRDGISWRSAAEMSGRRLWSDPQVRRAFGIGAATDRPRPGGGAKPQQAADQ